MPASKRSRACDACHSIKIKCELGSSGRDPPCSRCLRLGKNCFIFVSKSQKDRVAELEARVEFLTKTIESLKTSDASATLIGESPDASSIQKTPDLRIEEVKEPAASISSPSDQLRDLDSVVPLATQKVLYQKYINEICSRFDLIGLQDMYDFEALHLQKPLLFMAVTYAASDGILEVNQHERFGKILLDLIMPLTGSKVTKSLELVQALLITSLWYRLPTYHTKITPRELIHLAVDVAAEIGIDGTQTSPSGVLPLTNHIVSGVEARVALAVCRMLSSSIFIFLRIDPPISWSVHDDGALFMLESSIGGHEETRLIALYVRAEKLCGQIATQLDFSNFERFVDIAESTTRSIMQSLQNMITDWKAQIPPHLICPALKLWEYALSLYLNECVLHTPGNKQSFAAPFSSGRLSVTDFPKPLVTQDHINSLIALRDNAHALIDLFSALDTITIMSLPALLFASRVSYSAYILVKLYLATTADGNTFGAFVDSNSMILDEYLQKVIRTRDTIHSIDPDCGTAKILSMSLRLKEWLETYRSTNSTNGVHIQNGIDSTVYDYNWDDSSTDFSLIALEENGFLDPFSDLDLRITQTWDN